MCADEAGCAGDEYGETILTTDLGGGSDLFLPVEITDAGVTCVVKVSAAGSDEALEAYIRRR